MDKQVGEWINRQVGPRWQINWKKQPRKNNNKSKVEVGENTKGKNLVKGQHQKV